MLHTIGYHLEAWRILNKKQLNLKLDLELNLLMLSAVWLSPFISLCTKDLELQEFVEKR